MKKVAYITVVIGARIISRTVYAMLGVVVNTGTKSIAAKKPTVFNFEMEVSTLV